MDRRALLSLPLLLLSLLPACGPEATKAAPAAPSAAPRASAAEAVWRAPADAGVPPVTAPRAEELPRFTEVAVASRHSCARAEDGRVFCWGSVGALVGRAARDVYTPTAVPGLASVVQIATHGATLCALQKDSAVLCAKTDRDAYTPGEREPAETFRPSVVAGLPTAKAIALSRETLCAIVEDGGVACSGPDTSGGRGLGTAYGEGKQDAPPARVPGLTAVKRLVAGRNAPYGGFCAIDAGGRASCWGFGNPAQFPAGSIKDGDYIPDRGYPPSPGRVRGKVSSPTLLAGFEGVADLAWWDDGLCVQKAGGELACKGAKRCAVSREGRLGCWSKIASPLGRDVTAADVVAVDVGVEHACALTNAGEVRCWGNALHGATGTGVVFARSAPKRVDLPPAAQITAAYDNTCARLTDGSVRCWGQHGARVTPEQARLCDPTTPWEDEPRCPSPLPELPPGSADAIAGAAPLCLRASATSPWRCQSYSARGRAVPLRGIKGTPEAIGTYGFDFGVVAAGRAYRASFLSGTGRPSMPDLVPLAWTEGLVVKQLSGDLGCALLAGDEVACACRNEHGERDRRCGPADRSLRIPELRGAKALVRTPNQDVCVIDAQDRLRCVRDVPVPEEIAAMKRIVPAARTEVEPLANVVALVGPSLFEDGGSSWGDFRASYGGGACAITRAGEVHCWGDVRYAGAEDEDVVGIDVPRRIAGLPPVAEVALGAAHACARTRAGEVYCWGSDLHGALGLGAKGYVASPTPVARAR